MVTSNLHHKIPDFGELPGATIIPPGDSLIVDSPSAHTTLGVHGSLTVSSRLTLDNLLVYEDGTLTLLPGCEIVIKDTPIDTEADPHQWGQAVIVLGKWAARGGNKLPYARATEGIPVGASSVVIDADPVGWQVGDVLCLPRTTQHRKTKSELVTLTEIAGRTIRFTACQYDHPAISSNPFGVSRFPHIGNLTRSIKIRSENPAGTRGHTVCTMSADSDLTGVEFISLGRTRAEPINSTVENAGAIVHIGTNQIARYPDHMHHCMGQTRRSHCTYRDGLKWSLTVHATHDGLYENNVFYDATGAAVATENGHERNNKFRNNLVMYVHDGYQVGDVRAGVNKSSSVPVGNMNIDTGSESSGFWFRGPSSHVVENYVYDCAGHAFNYNGYYAGYPQQNILSFESNEACSSRGGLWLSWSQTTAGASIAEVYRRQVMQDFTAWHCFKGVLAFHEAFNSYLDFLVVGDGSIRYAGSQYHVEQRVAIGVDLGSQGGYENYDTILTGLRVSGYPIGVNMPQRFLNGSRIRDAQLANLIDFTFADKDFDGKVGKPQGSLIEFADVVYLPANVTQPKEWAGRFPAVKTHAWQKGVGEIVLVPTATPEPDPDPDPTPDPPPTDPDPDPDPDPTPATVTATVDGTTVIITGPVTSIELDP